MLKHLLVASICLLYLVSGLAGTILAKTANNDKRLDIIYINGDWIVSDTKLRENETIVLTGNLIIQSGGDLTFKNVTLKMNCTADWQRHIEVLNGGTLNILDLDNDNATITDASIITSTNSNFEFNFWVRPTATLEMRNSILTECGEFAGGVPEWEGLYIQSDNAIVDNCQINNCSIGVTLYGSDAVVSNNTIEWCDTGIRATTWSNGTVENNVVWASNSYGIYIDGWDNSVKRGSNPIVRGNKILYTGRGINTADALQIEYYSSPIIINNEIINYTEDGIYLGEQCHALLINNTFDACGGKYGIASSEPRSVNIVNCTIANAAWWDLSLAGAYFNLINSTFNDTKVKFWNPGDGSNVTVRWFLHVQTIDLFGNSVPDANIRIRDNANGTYDQNFTTGSNGWVNWTVLKEYCRTSSGNISYNSYNISVSKQGYFTSYLEVEMNESKYITITLQADENPIANAGPDQSVNEDDILYFNGSGSTDDVGITWYNWSFGDGDYDFGANVTTSHTYTNAGNYIVALNVSDADGNWANDTCFVFVNNVAPIADAGGNKTGNEGVAITFNGSASADTPSDNSTLIYVWYFGDGNSEAGKIVNHAYADNEVYNATLVVTDDNGYTDSDTLLVTINNVVPVIMPVANKTAQQGVQFTLRINATDVPADVLTFSDNTTLFDINPVTGIIQFTPTNDNVGNHSVNVTVTDDDMGSRSITFKITVLDTNDPPTIQPIGSQTATQDALFTLQLIASDPDGDTLTYSLTAYPTGMTIASTGLITWTPANAAVGSHAITVRVSDSLGLSDEKTFAITVANVNDAPAISTSSLANATEDSMYLYPIQANDMDVGDTLTYSLDSAPAFLSINPGNGLLYGTPMNAQVGTHQVLINVSDGTTHIIRTFNLTVINVNDPPTLNYIPPQAAIEDIVFSLQLVGQDVDIGDTITHSLISSLSGMTINQATGLIAWTPMNDDVGSHMVIVRVSDASGVFAERTFQIIVSNVNDEPTIITTALQNATEDSMYLATIHAEDVDGDVLTFSFDSSPSFLSIDTRTGMMYGMPTNNDVGVHRIVVNVSDGAAFVTRVFNLAVLNVNELPTITSYPVAVAKPGSEYTYTVIAEDADAGDVTYSLVEAPEGMAIDTQTGKISWTPTDAQAGQTYQVVVQVSDGNGSTTQTYSIAVDELPTEPYRPLFDDYVWVGIIIMLVTIIMLLLFYQIDTRRKEKEPEETEELEEEKELE